MTTGVSSKADRPTLSPRPLSWLRFRCPVMSSQANEENEKPRRSKASVRRFLKIALLVFGLLIGGVSITAVFVGEEGNLRFDYEGFD